jgi:hypothetical protein
LELPLTGPQLPGGAHPLADPAGGCCGEHAQIVDCLPGGGAIKTFGEHVGQRQHQACLVRADDAGERGAPR